MSLTPAARRWSRIIREQERSGLTNKEFAASKAVNASTLSWWRRRLRDQQQPLAVKPRVEFVEVEVEPKLPAEPVHEPSVVLYLDQISARVVIDAHTDLPLLRRALEALS